MASMWVEDNSNLKFGLLDLLDGGRGDRNAHIVPTCVLCGFESKIGSAISY